MSKKVNVSLYILMIGFVLSFGIQRFSLSEVYVKRFESLSLISVLGIIGITLLVKKENFKFFYEWSDLVYYMFLGAIVVSTWLSPQINHLDYLKKFVIQYLVLNIAVRNIPEYLNPKLFLTSFVIAYIPLIASHLIDDRSFLISSAYSGSFNNPNTFGLFMVPITVVWLSLTFFFLIKKSWIKFIVSSVFSFGNFYLTIISGSRTAFLAIALALVLASIFYMASLFEKINEKQRTLFFILLFLSVLLAYLILKDSYLALAFKESIIDKFAYQMQKSRLLSGRERIWKYYLKGSYPFESGLQTVQEKISLSPHNAFIEVISRFGQVAGFFYISFWLISLKKIVEYSVYNRVDNQYIPFYIMGIIAFLGSGMMEVVTYRPIAYLSMYINAMILSKMSVYKNSEKSITLAKIKNKMQS